MNCNCQNNKHNYPKQNINHLKNGFVLFQKINNCGGNNNISDKIIEITEDNIEVLENIYLETINDMNILHISEVIKPNEDNCSSSSSFIIILSKFGIL